MLNVNNNLAQQNNTQFVSKPLCDDPVETGLVKKNDTVGQPLCDPAVEELIQKNSNLVLRMGDNLSKVERPDTPEVEQHDKAKEFWMAIYDFLHPEPEPDSPALLSITGGEHAGWLRERQEAMNKWEESYRENNPEYAKQMEEYEQQRQDEIRRKGILM